MTVGEMVKWEFRKQVAENPEHVAFFKTLETLGIWDAEVLEAVVQPYFQAGKTFAEQTGGMICVHTHLENAGHSCRVIVLPAKEE